MTQMPPPRHFAAVHMGHFQPVHQGHVKALLLGLEEADHLIVVLGTARQARSPHHPFTTQERREMIRLALPAEVRQRVHFLPLRKHYDDVRWSRAVQQGVDRIIATLMPDGATAQAPSVVWVGTFSAPLSTPQDHFPHWHRLHCEPGSPLGAHDIRRALYAGHPRAIDATLAALGPALPASTTDFLRAWMTLPYLGQMVREWQALQSYQEAWAASPYPPVFVTVDAVVRCAGHVLLIRRGQAPGVGLCAVPGGFIEQRETAYQSAVRELIEETRLDVPPSELHSHLQASAVFDHPDRSPRGRTITHAFCFDLGERDLPQVQADDDALAAFWAPIDRLVDMEDQFHDDHFHILDHFIGLLPDPAD